MARNRDREGTPRPSSGRGGVRPNPKRQLFWVGIALASVAAGYVIGFFAFQEPAAPTRLAPDRKAEAWYLSQPPPPELVRTPSEPILPDPEAAIEPKTRPQGALPPPTDPIAEPDPDPAPTPLQGTPVRAYEEALPIEVYVPPPSVELTPPPAPPSIVQSSDQMPTWQRYALATPDTGGRPMIAVVIDDMGVDQKRSKATIALSGPLTLSFLDYAQNVVAQTQSASAAGHEIMLHMSMEPSNASLDAGPNVLKTSMAPDEVLSRLNRSISRLDKIVGINNHMGSKFTSDAFSVRIVMEELSRRGLLFLDSRTSSKSVGAEIAREIGVPTVQRNVFLDHINDVDAVRASLREVERIARKIGYVVAIGHPRDATLKVLKEWLPEVQTRGFALVPITAIVKRRHKL